MVYTVHHIRSDHCRPSLQAITAATVARPSDTAAAASLRAMSERHRAGAVPVCGATVAAVMALAAMAGNKLRRPYCASDGTPSGLALIEYARNDVLRR